MRSVASRIRPRWSERVAQSSSLMPPSLSKKKRKTYHGPQAVSMSGDDEEETEDGADEQKAESETANKEMIADSSSEAPVAQSKG